MVKVQQSQFLNFTFGRKYLIFNILLFSFLFVSAVSFAKVETGSFSYGGVSRSYLVFLPQAYDGSKKLPVVFNLHSDGKSAQWHSNYTGINSVADTAGFIVVYPDAYYTSAAGYKSFNRDAIIAPIMPNGPDNRDIGFIEALIDTMNSKYRTDLDRLYIAGLSGGGYLAFKMAFQFNNRFAAIAAVGPELSIATASSNTNLRKVPLLYFFGTNDPIIPFTKSAPAGWYNGEQILYFWTNYNNIFESDTTAMPNLDPNDGCTVEKMVYQTGDDNPLVIFYKVNNGGHTWPGAADYPSEAWAGRTCRDINANVEIWNFFKSFRRSQFSMPQHDLKVRSVPVELIRAPILANNFASTVTVRNAGVNDEIDISVTCQIDSAGTPVYSSTQIIDTLQSNKSKKVIFQDWHTYDAQTYRVLFYTSLSNDENLSNDTLKTSAKVSTLVDDFENGIEKWQSDNRWVALRSNAYGGILGLKNNLGVYENNLNTWIEYKSGFDLSQLAEAHISYLTKHTIQTDFDFGYVEVSGDGGQTWQQLGDAYTGDLSNWRKDRRSLTAFCGAGFTDIRIRFRFVSDSTIVRMGWFIDDINIYPHDIPAVDVREESNPLPNGFVLHNNYPNPFNPETTITYELPTSGLVRLDVYNMLGQKIKTLVDQNEVAGVHRIVWNGKNEFGEKMASGIYLYQMQTTNYKAMKRMLLLR